MYSEFVELLRKNNISLTRPRRKVFSYLLTHGSASIKQLISAIPAVDPVSVYRTLALFRSMGIVQDIITGGKKMVELTDRFNPHHHHLVCTNCGKSVDITEGATEQRLTALALRHGFTAQSHQIEVSGLCSGCSA